MKISNKIRDIIFLIHQAFMQPRKAEKGGVSKRKQYWIDTWSRVKNLSPEELEELYLGLQTTNQTLYKLMGKIEVLRVDKIKRAAENHSLDNLNEWNADEFLDSAINLPVFKLSEEGKGERWVITQPIEKPKNTVQICQCLWVAITNRAIHLMDKGKGFIEATPRQEMTMEKHRLAAIKAILDDKTVTDIVSGKPLMNLYRVNKEVKETFLWLLSERAKQNKKFRDLLILFLTKEVLKKTHLLEWAKKFAPQVQKIVEELKSI